MNTIVVITHYLIMHEILAAVEYITDAASRQYTVLVDADLFSVQKTFGGTENIYKVEEAELVNHSYAPLVIFTADYTLPTVTVLLQREYKTIFIAKISDTFSSVPGTGGHMVRRHATITDYCEVTQGALFSTHGWCLQHRRPISQCKTMFGFSVYVAP